MNTVLVRTAGPRGLALALLLLLGACASDASGARPVVDRADANVATDAQTATMDGMANMQSDGSSSNASSPDGRASTQGDAAQNDAGSLDDAATGGALDAGMDAGSVDAGISDAGYVFDYDASLPSSCSVGQEFTRQCGNCGIETASCVEGGWGSFGACRRQGECAPGTLDTKMCGTEQGLCTGQVRTCSASCSWDGYGACGEIDYLTPPTPEVCGDQVDNNCNGLTDEACGCKPVAPGAAGALWVSALNKLIPDPNACLLYGLAGTQIVVIDTASKSVLTAVELPSAATDLDISPDGMHLIAALNGANQLAVIDKTLWTATTIPAADASGVPWEPGTDPYVVEVSSTGLVSYVTRDREVWSEDVATHGSRLLGRAHSPPDLELSADGASLFAGESGPTCHLHRYSITGEPTVADETTWDDGYGFRDAARWVYLAPNERHIYFAGYQLDATNLAFVRGRTRQPPLYQDRVFAEDKAGTFAVSTQGLLDAELVRQVAAFPSDIWAAALSSADRELWYYDGALHYANVDDFLAGKNLGVRELPPASLSSYVFTKLVADPVRPRLYALDAEHELVVALDVTHGTPLGSVIVSSSPTDIEVDSSGTYLYVGHEDSNSIAQIRLSDFSFVRLMPTPRDNYDIAPLDGGTIATIDFDQWNTLALMEATTGRVLDSQQTISEGSLSASADGKTLFVAESASSASDVSRYDVSSGKLQKVADTASGFRDGFDTPTRHVIATPDATRLYYAGYCLDGVTLDNVIYAQADTIISVTPDSKLAISATKVYQVSDGKLLGSLPTTGSIQAVSPDGSKLYVWSSGALVTVDLAGF